MATKSKIRTTIELNPGDKERLQAVAEDMLLYQKTGVGRGTGSVSLLMQCIASGHLGVHGLYQEERRNRMNVRKLTALEIDAFPGESSVDVAIKSGGIWYYGDSYPTEADPSGLDGAQFVIDEDNDYIPVMAVSDRTAEVNWLRQLASNMAHDLGGGEGTAEELVEYALSDEGRESWGIELPDWFEAHDRALLVRFVQECLD